MAVRRELEVVAQVEPRAANDGDTAEARVVSALTQNVRDPLVAPERRNFLVEVCEEPVEVCVDAGPGNASLAVAERAPVGGDPVALRVAQHLAPIEPVQTI